MAPDGPPVERIASWRSVAPGVRRPDEEEQPGAVASAGREERVERVAAEVRVDREGVRERRLAARAGSRKAAAYARAVEPMSPRFASAITSSPASRAYRETASSARQPSLPSASKNAACGFTATT